ncbi:unnamed protein product [Lasius platythorax]|uniref:Uncharacterized protein n=1 Tax=Lasius platythorax TaxID=488582 RepID=A0AAV2NVD5_9HYME
MRRWPEGATTSESGGGKSRRGRSSNNAPETHRRWLGWYPIQNPVGEPTGVYKARTTYTISTMYAPQPPPQPLKN